MPGHISKALLKYQHVIPPLPQNQPYKFTPIQYGAKVQLVVEPDTSAPLTKDQIKHVQYIIGTLFYYGRAVNPTIFTSLIAIEPFQDKVIEAVFNEFHQLLEYVATHTNAAILCHASEMILALNTDALYLYGQSGKIRSAAYILLTNKNQPYLQNGAILIISGIFKHVMSSESEAEIGAL